MYVVKTSFLSIIILFISACAAPIEDDYLDGCKIRVSDVHNFNDRKTEPCKCTDLPK
jgi:hypothetical protein